MPGRFDIHFRLIDPGTQNEVHSTFTLGTDGVYLVRGPQKLVNRWLKEFFTPQGSDPLRRKGGSSFPSMIGGNIDPSDDLQMSVQTAIDETNDNIRALDQQSPWLTADERLLAAVITRFDQHRVDAIEFWVEIRTVSGARVQVLIPYASA